MQDLRVALAQFSPHLGDASANLDRHLEIVAEARRAGAGVVVFPELSLTGYVLRDMVPEVALAPGSPALARLAAASEGIDLIVGLVEESDDHRYYNAAAYFQRGALIHLHRKVYLPTYGLFQEGRDFAAGDVLRRFDVPFGPAGLLICEELWHPSCAWLLAQQGAQVIFTLSSSPTRGAKPGRGITSVAVWRDLLRVTAQFQTAFMIYVNRTGCEDGLTFGGGSMAVDPFGRVLAEAASLDEELLVVELDAGLVRRARTAYPLLRDERIELIHRELGRLRQERYRLPRSDEATDPEVLEP